MKEVIHFNTFEEFYRHARGEKPREPKEYTPKKKKKKEEK